MAINMTWTKLTGILSEDIDNEQVTHLVCQESLPIQSFMSPPFFEGKPNLEKRGPNVSLTRLEGLPPDFEYRV